MTSTTIEQKAEAAEAKAAELRAQAEAQAAERQRLLDEWQGRRDELEPTWWSERRSTYLARHHDAVADAWAAFTTEIREGRAGIEQWIEYRQAVTWRAADKSTIDRWFYSRAEAAYNQREQIAHDLHQRLSLCLVGGGSSEGQTAHNANMTVEAWRDRRDVAVSDAEKALGQQFDHDQRGVLAAMHSLPDWIGKKPSPWSVGSGIPSGLEHYHEAVDQVVGNVTKVTVERLEAERQAELEEWLDQQAGPAPDSR